MEYLKFWAAVFGMVCGLTVLVVMLYKLCEFFKDRIEHKKRIDAIRERLRRIE